MRFELIRAAKEWTAAKKAVVLRTYVPTLLPGTFVATRGNGCDHHARQFHGVTKSFSTCGNCSSCNFCVYELFSFVL